MKKRNQILAGVLAVLLGVSPSGVYGEAFYDVEDVADTDAAAQEITDVQDEESEQPEEVTAGEEGQETEFTAGTAVFAKNILVMKMKKRKYLLQTQ
ncbi:MAG: hypothetical protein ACLR5B_12145 [Blautia sp.]